MPADALALCLQSSAAIPASGLTRWLNQASTASAAELADMAGASRLRSSDRVSAPGLCAGHLPDLVMPAGARQQRLLVISAERMVLVRLANESMPQAVVAGDCARPRLNVRDDEFLGRLDEWARQDGQPDPQR